jgi:O-antigen/teichoic acid export membrane protein
LLKDLKQTFRHSVIYGVSRVSTKLTGFILLPLYSSYFSTNIYGVIVRVELIWQFLLVLFLFGLESGIIRWYSLNSDENKKKKFLFTIFLFIFILNLIFLCLIYFSSGFLSGFIFEFADYSKLIILASIVATAEAFIYIVFILIRVNNKPVLYTIFSILITFINLVLQVYFIKYSDIKLEGIFYSKIIAPVAVIVILSPYVIKFIKPGFLKDELYGLIRFSYPILLGNIIWMVVVQIDKFFLGFFANSSEVGIYGFASSITGVINFIVMFPFTLAFMVISWRKYSEGNSERFFTKVMTYLYYIIIFISVMLSLFIPNIIGIFIKNPEYYSSIKLIPFICLSIPLATIHFVGIFSFQASGKTKYIMYSYFITLFLNVVLNAVLISYFKSFGAAFANFISFLALNITIYIFSRKCFYFGYEWSKYLVLNIIFVLLIAPFYFIIFNSIYLELGLKFLAVLIFPFLLFLFNFYEKIEIDTVKNYFGKLILRK